MHFIKSAKLNVGTDYVTHTNIPKTVHVFLKGETTQRRHISSVINLLKKVIYKYLIMSFSVPSITANSVIEIDTKMQDIKITVLRYICTQNEILNAIYIIRIIFFFAFQYNDVRQITIYVTEGKTVVKIPPFTILGSADYFHIKNRSI